MSCAKEDDKKRWEFYKLIAFQEIQFKDRTLKSLEFAMDGRCTLPDSVVIAIGSLKADHI